MLKNKRCRNFSTSFASFRFCGKRGIRTAKPSPTRQRSRNLRLAISRGGNPCTKFAILSPVFIDTTTLVLFVFDDHSCKYIYIGVSSNTKKAGKSAGRINKNKRAVSLLLWAERGGFEPPKPFWSLHAFQACLFNHSSTFPYFLCKVNASWAENKINLFIFYPETQINLSKVNARSGGFAIRPHRV